ncbi:MAG: hypothetical protein ACPGU1_13085 [Myxococcota bacterium]
MQTIDPDLALIVLHAAATWFMTGLIWFVQVVHYPLKAAVGRGTFTTYQAQHVQRTGWVVGPPMIVEALTAAALVVLPSARVDEGAALVGLCLLVLVWASTALFSVPAHGRLAGGFDPGAHQRLVRTNWIRTVGWSARSGVACWLLLFGLQRGALA